MELTSLIDAFRIRLNQISDAFVRSRNEIKAPEFIYHYTDDVGLRGILESGQIWLNDIFSLNDPKEVQHGYETALHILLQKADLRRVAHAVDAARRSLDVLAMEGLRESAHLFVSSFSARGDDLGQWRAYADDGRGFALGFDGPKMEKLFFEAARPHNNTFRALYDQVKLEEVQASISNAYIDLIEEASKIGYNPNDWDFYRTTSAIFVDAAITLSLLFKHQAYLNEEEFRFLEVHDYKDIDFNYCTRSRPYKVVKYRVFDWRALDPGLLKSIIVGPTQLSQSTKFAKDCLEIYHRHYRSQVQVFHSMIPYQGR